MPMELTNEIREALASRPGDPLDLFDSQTRTDYILLRRDEYERLRVAREGADDEALLQARLDEATRIRREWVRENPY